MTNLVATAGWDNVPQIEVTTPLLGGNGGPLNGPAQALLNRTERLSADRLSVRKYTDAAGVAVDGTTSNQAAIVQAVADAVTINAIEVYRMG